MSLPSSQRPLGPQPRQIRFVSTDGQPQTKRRRVIAACRTCRKRKIRCSGEQPVCKTCSDYGHTCLGYSEPANPPTSAPPRSAVRLDEKDIQNKQKKQHGVHESTRTGAPAHATEAPSRPPNTRVDNNELPLRPPNPNPIRPVTDPSSVSSPESTRSSSSTSQRISVPYFRYFGPTAIVPGFKQMVVRVRETRKSNPSLSVESTSSLRNPNSRAVLSTLDGTAPSHSIHFYDPDDNLPNSELITHLCDVFFTHLGCNFPFLQRNRFLKDLSKKTLEPILVDAVCALAARFSIHPLLSSESVDGTDCPHHGDVFAHRAMCAVVDALFCPTLPVVQACLLLAYEEFGSNHDSGLWMYLGISIRMAQDLGIQKLEGLKFKYGRVGLTPKNIHSVRTLDNISETPVQYTKDDNNFQYPSQNENAEDERAKEREQVDSFWSIFFLDRVISSGTGRPVTLRDDDIEIHFPLESESELHNGWPSPYPPLMRVIHLYGRVTDLLNSIKEVNHVTPETLKQLAEKESDLTGIYQKLSLKLHFNAVNFQNYVKFGEGTNFILLHFWFHTLIVLLHQPTLLHSFSGKIQKLFHNSRELSMSSAKTIADTLAFAELIDAKSFIGNPFTSQPIYIAACAFLMESAYYSLPSSRAESPPTQPHPGEQDFRLSGSATNASASSEGNSNAKHTLLAAAAKDNYQRCYKALQSLETYWAGTKYILTALDQKAKGIWDPILYTEEEMDSAVDLRPVRASLASFGWKRSETDEEGQKSSNKGDKATQSSHRPSDGSQYTSLGSPKLDPNQAIGWALAGATNSSQPNLSVLYQLPSTGNGMPPLHPESTPTRYRNSIDSTPYQNSSAPQGIHPYPHPNPQYQRSESLHVPTPPAQHSVPSNFSNMASDNMSPSNAAFGLAHNSRFSTPNTAQVGSRHSTPHDVSLGLGGANTPYSYPDPSIALPHTPSGGYGERATNIQGMTIESQDVDMNTLHTPAGLPFAADGGFVPWLEYLPADVLSFFGDNQN